MHGQLAVEPRNVFLDRLLLELGGVCLLRYLEHLRLPVNGNCTLPLEDEIRGEAHTSLCTLYLWCCTTNGDDELQTRD